MLHKLSDLKEFESKVAETVDDMPLDKHLALVDVCFRRLFHLNLRTGSQNGKRHLLLIVIQIGLVSKHYSFLSGIPFLDFIGQLPDVSLCIVHDILF
jgi:hypothetical protein